MKKALLIVGIFIVLGIIGISLLLIKGLNDGPKVQQVVTQFLQYAAKEDVEGAYSLTSSEFKQTVTKEEMQQLFLVRALFDGFSSQTQTGFYVKKNLGEPTQYNYSGTVQYTDGSAGTVTAVLIQEKGIYKVINIKVNVGIDRFKKFNESVPTSVLGTSTN